MKVGFIGLGAMGSAIAANVIRAGNEVTVWNRSPGHADALAALGAKVAKNPEEALGGDVALSILSNDDALRAVGLDGPLLAHAANGLVHVNMATVSTAFARAAAASHEKAGVGYVACPVFGRPDAAAAAKLVLVASGAPAAVEKVRPVLEPLGQRLAIVGESPEQANLLKIAGNFMLASAIESIAEAIALVRKGGIDANLFHDIMSNGLFAAPVYKGYGSLIAREDYDHVGFTTRLGLKDVNLALAAGSELTVPLPMASLVRDHLMEAMAKGWSERDWASLGGIAATKAGL